MPPICSGSCVRAESVLCPATLLPQRLCSARQTDHSSCDTSRNSVGTRMSGIADFNHGSIGGALVDLVGSAGVAGRFWQRLRSLSEVQSFETQSRGSLTFPIAKSRVQTRIPDLTGLISPNTPPRCPSRVLSIEPSSSRRNHEADLANRHSSDHVVGDFFVEIQPTKPRSAIDSRNRACIYCAYE